ncbi:hypothetical protein [Variovorax sp. W6]|uniref:hypothetical protein n=1 Tax=Variovorax sp. W6 TaxID=3093895 RepID=UPI003D802859
MFYIESDVLRLLHAISYFRFMKPEGALRFWTKLRDDGKELAHMLRQFPSVMYEPLDTLYACARAVASLDEKLIADLSAHYTWRGVTQASFLAALQPHAAYASHLRMARDGVPHNQWIVDLALCEIRGSSCKPYPEHQAVIRELREVIACVSKQPVSLRRAPTAEELLHLQSASAEISDAYKRGGVALAKAVLDGSAWRPFL